MTPRIVSRRQWWIYKSDPSGGEVCYLTLEGLSRFSKLPVPSLRRMMKQGLIAPLPEQEALFPQETVRRVARIERLRTQLRLDLDSLEVVLDLLDRMEEMEREIALLKREFRER
ncbi:MAG TPA: chaperone modulator CbpM [Candidatus Manganitrophaceae bacterium]|nr:chaperone modulator CbpM [Candidatus Manganitrophaceae bacterium]